MAQHHTPVEVDPKELKRAQDMWHAVTQAGKWSIVGIVLVLIGLATAFIR